MSEPTREPKAKHSYEALHEQLDLVHLPWVTVDVDIDPTPPIPCTIRETAQQSINLAGRIIRLEADHMKSDTNIREFYNFTIIDHDQEVLQITLMLTSSAHGVVVATNIGKISQSRVPGMPLYHKVLDYIQTLATQRDQSMLHQVKRSVGNTRLGRQVLGTDDWYVKFAPTLQERGYKKVTDFIWEKTYLPMIEADQLR